MGLIVAAFAIVSYYSSSDYNPITGETQRVAISADEEIAMGLQAAPTMARQYGGLHPDPGYQAQVDYIGNQLVQNSAARDTDWKFDFHLLADDQTINAFALPGGQIFITYALFSRLTTDGQLAAVLGHEIGHVVARHGAEHIAKQLLAQGLTGAAVIASGDHGVGQMAAMVGQMVNMKYGRADELESDRLGVRFMAESGYDPRAMLKVMKILAEAGGGSQPEFFNTHPNPENRIDEINRAIQETFPNDVPNGLKE